MLVKCNSWDPARPSTSDHLRLKINTHAIYISAEGNREIQTYTMIYFLTLIIPLWDTSLQKPCKCSTWTVNICSNGQIGTSRVWEAVWSLMEKIMKCEIRDRCRSIFQMCLSSPCGSKWWARYDIDIDVACTIYTCWMKIQASSSNLIVLKNIMYFVFRFLQPWKSMF